MSNLVFHDKSGFIIYHLYSCLDGSDNLPDRYYDSRSFSIYECFELYRTEFNLSDQDVIYSEILEVLN